jgi:hypothetical protein
MLERRFDLLERLAGEIPLRGGQLTLQRVLWTEWTHSPKS